MYIPRLQLTSALVSPAQKWDRSPRPMVSNQNTLFRCVVQAGRDQQTVQECVDASADSRPGLAMPLAESDQTAEDHEARRTAALTETTMEISAGGDRYTKRLPEKNASQSGSCVLLNLL